MQFNVNLEQITWEKVEHDFDIVNISNPDNSDMIKEAKEKELQKIKDFNTYEEVTLCGVELPITAYVDNKSLVESIYSTSLVDDKRLRIDIAALI